jgi:hypothetical protein
MGARIVGGFLQTHQHVQQGIPLVLGLGGGAALQPHVFGRDSSQALGRRPRPRISVQDELSGVRPRRPPPVQLQPLSRRLPQVGGQRVVPHVGEPGPRGVQLQRTTYKDPLSAPPPHDRRPLTQKQSGSYRYVPGTVRLEEGVQVLPHSRQPP